MEEARNLPGPQSPDQGSRVDAGEEPLFDNQSKNKLTAEQAYREFMDEVRQADAKLVSDAAAGGGGAVPAGPTDPMHRMMTVVKGATNSRRTSHGQSQHPARGHKTSIRKSEKGRGRTSSQVEQTERKATRKHRHKEGSLGTVGRGSVVSDRTHSAHSDRSDGSDASAKTKDTFNSSDFDTDLEDDGKPGARASGSQSKQKTMVGTGQAGLGSRSNTAVPPAPEINWIANYEKACSKLGTVPVSAFIMQLKQGKALSLRGVKLSSKDVLAIVYVLIDRVDLSAVEFRESLEADGVPHIALMLNENKSLEEISLADNDLGSEAMTHLLSKTNLFDRITMLNLSGNRLNDRSAEEIAEMLRGSSGMKSLNVSRNEFSTEGIKKLCTAIADNTSILTLDLSWNHIGLGAASEAGRPIAEMVAENISIKTLNLSWNGLGDSGAEMLGRALGQNVGINELDISCNRIGLKGAAALGKALNQNETLQTFKLNKNSITTKGAELILGWTKKNENCKLMKIEMEGVAVTYAFASILESLLCTRPGMAVKHGPYVQNDDVMVERASILKLPSDPDEPPVIHPLLAGKPPVQVTEEEILRTYLSKKHINILKYVAPTPAPSFSNISFGTPSPSLLQDIIEHMNAPPSATATGAGAEKQEDPLVGTLLLVNIFRQLLNKIVAPLDGKQRDKLCKAKANKENRIDISPFLPENLPPALEYDEYMVTPRTARREVSLLQV